MNKRVSRVEVAYKTIQYKILYHTSKQMIQEGIHHITSISEFLSQARTWETKLIRKELKYLGTNVAQKWKWKRSEIVRVSGGLAELFFFNEYEFCRILTFSSWISWGSLFIFSSVLPIRNNATAHTYSSKSITLSLFASIAANNLGRTCFLIYWEEGTATTQFWEEKMNEARNKCNLGTFYSDHKKLLDRSEIRKGLSSCFLKFIAKKTTDAKSALFTSITLRYYDFVPE